ncbi:hypothetical protein Javan173_0041 [Streptococcus phage Javan173]|nr:hypothetical protein Javan173_0041 [Streptococcus phage Javan173]
MELLLQSLQRWNATGDEEHYQDLQRILDYQEGEENGC